MKSNKPSYKDFYDKHISIIKKENKVCSECLKRLSGSYEEVAHILEKQKYKELAEIDDNIIYLCGYKSMNNCHGKFDSTNNNLQSMDVFNKVRGIVLHFYNEGYDIHYKDLIRFNIEI